MSTETKIHVLPESISCQIAAGEIVDRPASVVKELVDNSLDAGSSRIYIDAFEGGKRLLRVTDDGGGMSRTDAQLACKRFATSKLRCAEDLLSIATFGFRGEALPSIASVSKFRLLTAKQDELVGTLLTTEGGQVFSVEEQVFSRGTKIEVEELFFNTPGRQKFLKSTPTEFSHVCHVVQRASLASPSTQFRLTHNNNLVFDFPVVLSLQDRLLQLYGKKLMDLMLPIEFESDMIKVKGVAINPYHARTSRTPQEIFVNWRSVKNSTITHAVYEAYGSFLPKGRHPVFAIFLEISPGNVDVNVHPAKREVKFSSPDIVHRVVKEAMRSPLQKRITAIQSENTTQVQQVKGILEPRLYGNIAAGLKRTTSFESDQFSEIQDVQNILPKDVIQSFKKITQEEIVDEAKASDLVGLDFLVHILGQMNLTYIVAQVGQEFHVVDQHTVHERVLFERLWRNWLEKDVQSQALLIPEPVDVQPHSAVLLESALPELEKLGLEMEPFGKASFVMRSVPALLGQMDYAALVQDLIDDLSEWKSLDSIEKRIRPILASMACQGAVQAGRVMAEPEMKVVLEDWVKEGFPMTCPHGRRVAMRFSIEELHRIFQRI